MYGFDMEAIVHTKAIYYPYMGHSLCHTISILGPYLAHITRVVLHIGLTSCTFPPWTEMPKKNYYDYA